MITLHKILFLAACCLLVLVGVQPAHAQDSVGVWSQNLTNSTRVYTMDISASNGNLIYCAGLDSGVYKTTNGGVTWAAVNTGLTYNHVQTIAMSQSNNSILYCGTDQLGTTNSGVYKSTDGGASWTFASTGILETSRGIQVIVVHPTNPNIAWISVFDGLVNSTTGLYKTTDGGANWVSSNTGIGSVKNILALAINPLNPNTLYCGTSFSVVAPALRSRVYRSIDGGANWVDMSSGLPTDTTIGHPIRALSISTVDTNVILAALFLASDTLGGAYVTTNGGTTWVRKHTGLQSVNGALLRACLIKPGSSTEFYVGLDGGTATARGVWRTTDGGTSWSDFNNGTMANTYTMRALVFKTQGNPTLYAGAANAAVAVAGRGVYEYSWAGPPPPTILVANPGPANNGLTASGAAMFFNLIAGSRRVTIAEMTTANSAAANVSFTVQFFTRTGNALGGPVGSGPGSSSAGWTSVGTVPVTQGSVAAGISLPFSTPNITVNPGDTAGVAMLFTGAGPRYFGTGTPPYETYSDANLTLVTGDVRSAPFTTTGTFFASRALVGEIRYTSGAAGPTYNVPEVLYLKFNGGPTSTPNYAIPGRGNATATVTGHTISPGGQFDSTLLGTEGTGATNWVDNAWAPNLGNGSWTIGFWVSGLHLPVTVGNPCYMFGDVNTTAFRCFWAGAGVSPTDTAILFRKTGQPDMRLVLPNPSLGQSSYVHFVYDSVTATLKGYRNGVLGNTVTWTAPAITGPGPFKIAGYSTAANSLVSGAKMDEFRVYSRALDTTEIRQTWNHTLPYTPITSVEPPSQGMPSEYELAQNYPNPFNPTTTIQYRLAAAANVTLKVYNILGQEIVTLVNEQKSTGTFQVVWNGDNSVGNLVASGVYFYSLVAKSADNATTYTNIKKMLFLK